MIHLLMIILIISCGILLVYSHYLRQKQRQHSREKFWAKDGITLYDSCISQDPGRATIALLLKGVNFTKIDVDVARFEHKSDLYLKVSPNGDVPVLRIQNIEGIADCCLYGADVIIDFLESFLPESAPLYPTDHYKRAQIKMWEEWGQAGWQDFLPMLLGNNLVYLWRLQYRTIDEFANYLPEALSPRKREEYIRLYDTGPSHDQLLENGIECYRNLLRLEKSLVDADFLVGSEFSMADVAAYPLVSMYKSVGLPINPQSFPNVHRYIAHLKMYSVFQESEARSFLSLLLFKIFPIFSGPIVAMSNWVSYKNQMLFDGGRALERVLDEDFFRMEHDEAYLESTCTSELPIISDYITAAESLQMKILLNEMGVEFISRKQDFMEIIGRSQSYCSFYRSQLGHRFLIGAKTTMEYFDSIYGNSRYIPKEPFLRAECASWQMWDQSFYINDLSHVFEREWVSQMLHSRFPPNKINQLLDLRCHPHYFSRFNYIMTLYLHWITPSSPYWYQLHEEFRHLAESHDIYCKAKQDAYYTIACRLLIIETRLKNRKYLVGSSLTIADICVFCRLLLLPLAGFKISPCKYPCLIDWMKRIRKRRSVKVVVDAFDKEISDYE